MDGIGGVKKGLYCKRGTITNRKLTSPRPGSATTSRQRDPGLYFHLRRIIKMVKPQVEIYAVFGMSLGYSPITYLAEDSPITSNVL